METDYNQIAGQYRRAKLQPWRTHIERCTLLQLAGDLQHRSIADLACGEGYYTRELRRRTTSRVVGVDMSSEMIRLARAEESREPLGIEYRVGDVRTLDIPEQFDIVFAAYLLNYARTADDLLQMCRSIARLLKPGGRFVTVNNHPNDPPDNFAMGEQYGFSKRLEGPLREGAPVIWQLFLPDGRLDIENYFLSVSTMERVMQEAGLVDIRWHAPQVSAAGVQEFGSDYWTPFLNGPPVAFIECTREPKT